MSDGPSAFRIEQALSAWEAARSRLIEDDADLGRDEDALSELLGPKEGDVKDVFARVVRAARHAKVMADGAGELIEEMQGRKTRYQRRNEALRGTAFAIMQVMEWQKQEFPDLTVSIRLGQPSVIITDEEAIPDIYTRVERKIDRATILSALKSGLSVEGAELSNSAATLNIRAK